MTPDQTASAIFLGASLPSLPVAILAVVFDFTGHPVAGAITAAVFVALVILLLTVIRPLIFRRVRQVSEQGEG